ncbi:MAG TPA: cytochrome c, partial [Terriglobales bacterium]
LLAKRDWSPSSAAVAAANISEGERLFRVHCATCHAENGPTRLKWHASFKRLPPDLRVGPFLHVSDSASPSDRKDRLARIVKFGIAGTDMPGHEYLSDENIASLSLWLAKGQLKPMQHQ